MREYTVISLIDQPSRFYKVVWSPIDVRYYRTLDDTLEETIGTIRAIRQEEDFKDILDGRPAKQVRMHYETVKGYGCQIRNEDGTREWLFFDKFDELTAFLKTVNG